MATVTLLLLACVVAGVFVFKIWNLLILKELWRYELRLIKKSRGATRDRPKQTPHVTD
jgi:hypothetical protein